MNTTEIKVNRLSWKNNTIWFCEIGSSQWIEFKPRYFSKTNQLRIEGSIDNCAYVIDYLPSNVKELFIKTEIYAFMKPVDINIPNFVEKLYVDTKYHEYVGISIKFFYREDLDVFMDVNSASYGFSRSQIRKLKRYTGTPFCLDFKELNNENVPPFAIDKCTCIVDKKCTSIIDNDCTLVDNDCTLVDNDCTLVDNDCTLVDNKYQTDSIPDVITDKVFNEMEKLSRKNSSILKKIYNWMIESAEKGLFHEIEPLTLHNTTVSYFMNFVSCDRFELFQEENNVIIARKE